MLITNPKDRLFEMMNKVGKMPINENNVKFLTKDQFLNEIDFDDTFGDVSKSCLRPDAIVSWLNDELERLNHNHKNQKDRISRGIRTPIVTKGNVQKLKTETGDINIDMFIKNITAQPKTIFDSNPKAERSDKGRAQLTVNTGLPAIVGIVYDIDKSQFYSITSCPSAGACQVGCYARKAFYGMDDSKTMKITQRLNLLLNDPDTYEKRVLHELEGYLLTLPKGYQFIIRWNDAGDFFGDKYFRIAVKVTNLLLERGLDVKSYAYTKRSEYVIELNDNDKFVVNFSTDAAKSDIDTVNDFDTKRQVKLSHRVPKEVFRDFFVKVGPHYAKDENGLAKYINSDAPDALKNKIFNLYGDQFKFTRDSLKFTYELPHIENKDDFRKYNVIVLPTGDNDIAAQRHDVRMSFLLEH